MKWSVRGACAALASCLLLACALSAAAVGLKCFSLGSELRGEPFRLGAAAGAFYSGLLLAAGLSLLGAALLCCGPREAPLAGPPGPEAGPGLGVPSAPSGAPEASSGEAAPAAGRPGPVNSQNLLLLGVLVFMLGVLSAFAGAVIDGDTVSLVERKYSHYCLPSRTPAAAPGAVAPGSGSGPGSGPGAPRARSALDSATSAKCRQLKDYQRGLVLSTVFNSLECLLGLLSLLLVKNYKSSQARRGRRGRRRAGRALARSRGGPGLRVQPPASRARRGRRGRRGRRLQPRPSEASILSPEESDFSAPGDCAGFAPLHAVSYINVGVLHAFDEAGVEVCCGGHPSVELPGYAPSDPDLNASYPYCCRPPCEPAARPREQSRAC
ncbi:transmembrane protein 271 [Thomomys bottae]